MRRSTRDAGFELLAGLRRLERRMGRAQRNWRLFREDPTPANLEDVRRQLQQLQGELADLTVALDEDVAGGSGRGPMQLARVEPAERPGARDVVRASRELGDWVAQASSRWKAVIDDPSEERIRHLGHVLERAADQAGVLALALGDTTDRHRPHASGTGRPVGSAESRIETAAAELEASLWRVQSDWHHVRQTPSLERIRILAAELRQAAAQAAGLLRDVHQAGATAFRRAAQAGARSADAVRFRPFRDPFTGTYNREGFDTLASAELKRCRRYGRRFGLLMLEITPVDLDGLRELIAIARSELRGYDLLARYSGDLLVIGLPEGGAGPARRVAARILNAIDRSGSGDAIRSLAYATMPDEASTLSGLVDAARTRMATVGETDATVEGAQP